jgi:hypothetical protein
VGGRERHSTYQRSTCRAKRPNSPPKAAFPGNKRESVADRDRSAMPNLRRCRGIGRIRMAGGRRYLQDVLAGAHAASRRLAALSCSVATNGGFLALAAVLPHPCSVAQDSYCKVPLTCSRSGAAPARRGTDVAGLTEGYAGCGGTLQCVHAPFRLPRLTGTSTSPRRLHTIVERF